MAKASKALSTKAKTTKPRGERGAKAGGAASQKKRNVLTAIEGLGAQGLEWWPIADVRPYGQNVKKHPDDQVAALAEQIAANGFNVPILVDKVGVVLAGHGRLLAAEKLGLERVPVIRLDHLTPAQARAFRLADNQIPLLGDWDAAALAAELRKVRDEDGINLATLGFDDKALAAAFKSGGFLSDLLAGDDGEGGEGGGLRLNGKGVALKFDVLAADRDAVVMWLGQERDRRQLRTAAEALVAIAREGLKKKGE
jgi:hypothetical protein